MKLYWFVFMCMLLMWRFIEGYHWKTKLHGRKYNATKPQLRFSIARYLTALALSGYSVIFFNSMDIIELATTIVVMSSMAGGAATILSANKWLAQSYSVILLVPISIKCLFSGESHLVIFGLLGLVFTVIMYLSARRTFNFTYESILIKNRHSDLLKEMEDKNKQISEANSNLEDKIKQRTEEIFELSHIDPLTKLFNRTAFSDNLKLLIDSCALNNSTLAVLFVDLDGFKSINDSHGHAIGDKVLIETAKRLNSRAAIPKSVCRWGGDEFLIALKDTDENHAYNYGRALIKRLSQPIEVDHHSLKLGATVGIAMYPEHGVNDVQLTALADTAMYVQKQSAKSDVCLFTEEMRETLYRDIMLKEGLTQALEKGEFYVTFQPVIHCQSRKVDFCEALLRWRLGNELISPEEFIPAAEQHGFIQSIGSWVLHKACLQAADWPFDNTVDLSVNVSIAQLMHGDLIPVVKSALKKSNFPAENLHIEITESIFTHNIDYVLNQMRALQSLGIKVSLDDFGTGFSSLALLQSLSADVVKIDRSFVSSIDNGGKAIIQATQYMAKELGYSVVAEGVESKTQADVLSAMGVESLQGFYFSKPMRLEELEQWHDAYKKLMNT